MIHPPTALLVVGFICIALPITAWTILYRRHDRTTVMLWCSGGLLYGTGILLIGFRGISPDWLTIYIANPLAFSAYIFRTAALKRELEEKSSPAKLLLVFFTFIFVFFAVSTFARLDAPRILVVLCAHALGAGWISFLSVKLYQKDKFRSAALLAAAYAAFSAVLIFRIINVADNWESSRPMSGQLDLILSYVGAVIAALYGNLGYIGISLEISKTKELKNAIELVREQERRVQTEHYLAEQMALLQERGRLLAQRDEMLAAMAHEVRQPLNNASAALQSAASELAKNSELHEGTLSRLERATSVLTQITSSIDNTLTDAVLLDGKTPIARHDIDINTFIDLVVAEIDPAGRNRIHRTSATEVRTVSIHSGLMRIALRNLLINSLTYSLGRLPVEIHIAEIAEPLALIIEVRDQGEGIHPDLLPMLFSRGARGPGTSGALGHGLGLYIVKKVTELHGGNISIRPNHPSGVIASIRIPQGILSI